MKTQDRRKEIGLYLMSKQQPVSGTALSEKFGVSRQIIVQDISYLKDAGYEILSTRRGYIVQKSPFVTKVFKVRHESSQSEKELNTIVDFGGTVVDVFVWHKVYGKISAPLNISSRLQVKQFIEGVRTGKSTELLNITGGYHYHTIRAENNEILDLIVKELKNNDFEIFDED